MASHRTQVGIVGAGPAGLMLSHLLHLHGINSIVLENRSRAYCEERIRAGVLEQGTVDLLHQAGVADRLHRESMRHEGVDLGLNGRLHRISFVELTGKTVTVYGQQEVVKDLIARRFADDGDIRFECGEVTLHRLDTDQPLLRVNKDGAEDEIRCDYIAGCDGFHGVCRPSIPADALTTFTRIYPFAWLGVLAEAPPTREELLYMHHDRGFALYSMRSPTLTRLYLQCSPEEDIGQWSDERIWDELHRRLLCSDGWAPAKGRILQKGVTGMRSFVVEPMQYRRLFLAGDAAHIVPPTGAKGMNLAIADVHYLAEALSHHYRANSDDRLTAYSAVCLRRVWWAQRFSWWLTTLLHLSDEHSPFDRRRQRAELEYLMSSHAAATSLAENYVGLPFEHFQA